MMLKRLRAACIQMGASADCDSNLLRATALAGRAIRQKARFLAFPENFLWRGPARDLKRAAACVPQAVRHFQNLARQTRTAILLGSVLEPSAVKGKFYNTSLLLSESGKITAKYRKIHLFDVGLKRVRVDESRYIAAGKQPVVGKVLNVPLGLTICYDLRFPELFRAEVFRGAKIIAVPANFTEYTGLAHWEVLLRARAIENQVFIAAPGQVGVHPESKIRSFGTSLILDPWGNVLARGSRAKEEVVLGDLDFSFQNHLRSSFPVLKHTRI
jgi:predicted amidohydrolase